MSQPKLTKEEIQNILDDVVFNSCAIDTGKLR